MHQRPGVLKRGTYKKYVLSCYKGDADRGWRLMFEEVGIVSRKEKALTLMSTERMKTGFFVMG